LTLRSCKRYFINCMGIFVTPMLIIFTDDILTECILCLMWEFRSRDPLATGSWNQLQ
jgi:hypothetical protein